jgi:hypothetical protein
MDTTHLEGAYSEVIDVLAHNRFAKPQSGWTVELTVAHLIANDQLFTGVGEAITTGARPGYDNRAAIAGDNLARIVDETGGLPELTLAFGESSRKLLAMAAAITPDQAAAEIRFRVFHDGAEIVDWQRAWGAIVASIGKVHLPMHLRQLESLVVRL